jgi:predicted phosphodiesterase
MKLAFIGDIHLDDKNPGSRIDNYCVAVIKKLDWVFNWCREHEVDKIILLGDLFHRRDVGGRARNLCVKLMQKHYSFPGAPEILATIGNHDTGNDSANLKSTTLWTFVQVGYIKICDYDEASRVAFKHHEVYVEEDIVKNGLSHPDALIWSAHAYIMPAANKFAISFDDIAIDGPAKAIICGHVHATYSAKRQDGKILINPGNVGRNAYLNLVKTQPVQFLVIEHDNTNITGMEYIDIEAALPYDRVFNIDKIKKQAKIRNQVRDLVSTGDGVDIDIYSLDAIIELAKKQISKQSVVDLIAKYLGEAHEKS